MWIGALRLTFRLRLARSLKDKRRAANQIRDRVRGRFPVAIAEVEGADDLRRLVLGVSTVGNDPREIRSALDRIIDFIEGLYVAEIVGRDVAIHRMDPELPLSSGELG